MEGPHSSRRSENPSSRGKIGKGESQVQKETDYRAIRARRYSEFLTQTEAVEAEKETTRVQKGQDEARREAEKRVGKVQEEQGVTRREAEKSAGRVREEQGGARREVEKMTARIQEEQGRARREAESGAPGVDT
ncbi:hypothetical protein V8E54_008236 [Elaphomyces granulatus]